MRICGYDFESWLIKPGRLAPPPVCLTMRSELDRGIWVKDDIRAAAESVLSYEIIFGANVAYDMGVMGEAHPEFIPDIFKAYDEDRVWDVQIMAMMVDNAAGVLGGYVDEHGKKIEYKYNLGALSYRYLGKDRSAQKTGDNIWRMRYYELRDVPLELWPQEAVDYAMEDADDAYLIGVKLLDEIDPRVFRDAPNQMRKAWALHLQSCWGVHTSEERIREYEGSLRGHFNELNELLLKEGLLKVKNKKGELSRDTKKAAERQKAAYEAMGEEPPPTESGKGIALDKDACEDSHDEVMIAYAERTSLAGILETHIPALLKGVHEPIQPSYNPFLETGRTSCKGPEGKKSKTRPKQWCPKHDKECILDGEESRKCIVCGEYAPATIGFQVQNPRRKSVINVRNEDGTYKKVEAKGDVRSCFEARPGHVFIDCDFTGLELCTVAEVLLNVVGWSKLAEALNAGKDPHLMMAANMAGISYEAALEIKGSPDMKHKRDGAKPVNFGGPGGLGPRGFVKFVRKGYGIRLAPTWDESLVRAKELLYGWKETWPEFKEYFAIAAGLTSEGFCEELEVLYTGLIRGMVTYTEWCNTNFQALGAAVAGKALYAVAKDCYVKSYCELCDGHGADTDPPHDKCDRCGGSGVSPLFGVRPVMFIHDQIIAEAPEETAHEAACEMARVMVTAGNVYLPNVPVRCDPAISKNWSKLAEGVYDENGRLVCWDIARENKMKVWDKSGKEVRWTW